MGFEDQLLNVSPPRPFPKEKARVLEMGAGVKPCPAKEEEQEGALKAMYKCPCIGCDDPTVDNGCVEAESAPLAKVLPVSGSSGCDACFVLLRTLQYLDEDHPQADNVVFSGDDDASASVSIAATQNDHGSSTPSDQTTEEVDDCLSAGYETPTESVFNPFAPGPEELGEFAPMMIVPRASRARRVPLRRQLQFDSCVSSPSSAADDDDGTSKGADLTAGSSRRDDELDEDDKRLMDSLYATHYNFILSTLLVDQSPSPPRGSSLSEVDESPGTPSPVPFLTAVAETCPGAPVRHVSKARKLDPAICRKLDFS